MASLDARGDISVALVVIYTIILLVALVLALRHGFAKKDGWFFIMLFSVCEHYCHRYVRRDTHGFLSPYYRRSDIHGSRAGIQPK